MKKTKTIFEINHSAAATPTGSGLRRMLAYAMMSDTTSAGKRGRRGCEAMARAGVSKENQPAAVYRETNCGVSFNILHFWVAWYLSSFICVRTLTCCRSHAPIQYPSQSPVQHLSAPRSLRNHAVQHSSPVKMLRALLEHGVWTPLHVHGQLMAHSQRWPRSGPRTILHPPLT